MNTPETECPPLRGKGFDELVAFIATHKHVPETVGKLSAGQRAMFAAAVSVRSMLSQPEAGELFGVNRCTVKNAKVIWQEGTDEEIETVRSGKAGLHSLYVRIIARTKGKVWRKPSRQKDVLGVGRNPERVQNQKIRAEVWGKLRDALVALTSMPLMEDVVNVARSCDRTGLVDSRVHKALACLEGFRDAWTASGSAAAAKDCNGHDAQDAAVEECARV